MKTPQNINPIRVWSSVLFTPVRLLVSAGVRYWEDATVNGVKDENGTLIPLRSGDRWKPTIELTTGRVMDWPQGITAKIHYKVCDDGEYWLEDAQGARIKYKGDYVPNGLLCMGYDGYGDYIILTINTNGIIEDWNPPTTFDEDDWITGKNDDQ